MANRQRSLSMSDAIRLSPQLMRRQLPVRLAQAAEESRTMLENFFVSLPRLTEQDLIALNEADSSCPVCLTSFMAIVAEEEMALAMDSPATPVEQLGVTRLTSTCGHVFCRKDIRNWLTQGRNSCPTCRQQLLDLPGGGQLRELLEIRQEMSEHVRQMGGLLPLTDEQSEALGAAVLLLAQGDTESQLDFDIPVPPQYTANPNDDRHTLGGMYA